MTSFLPGLTLSSPDGTEAIKSRLADSPRLGAHRPLDLKLPPLEQPDDEGFSPKSPCSPLNSLKIPSPTYQMMFTPEFLIHSLHSEDESSDGFSSSVADMDHANCILPTRRSVSLWSSRAEHVKPLVNRFINEETKKHNSLRLAWQSARAATASEACGSSTTSSEMPNLDSTEIQSSLWLTCHGHRKNSIPGTHDSCSSPRRTKSLAELSTKGLPKSRQLFNSFWDSASDYPYINKENEIKCWVSAVSVT